MTWIEVSALITSGLFVGFINTLAGGGTIISLSLLMFLGLPADVANGTNRIAVIFQNLVAVSEFKKHKVLELKKGIYMGIPTAIGSVAGAFIAVDLNQKVIEYAIAFVMLLMLFFIFFKPGQWLKGKVSLQEKKLTVGQMILYFFIGIYGGFIHVGVGYFLIAMVVLGSGYDLVKGNALKNLIVLIYVPFSLVVYMISGHVNYKYGLIHAIGNVIGAYVATRFAFRKGANFVRWVMLFVIIISISQIFGLIDFKAIFSTLIS
jgi:uncharacterized protein